MVEASRLSRIVKERRTKSERACVVGMCVSVCVCVSEKKRETKGVTNRISRVWCVLYVKKKEEEKKTTEKENVIWLNREFA